MSSPQNGSVHVGHESFYRTVRSTLKHEIAEANENSEVTTYSKGGIFFYELCFTIHDLALVLGDVAQCIHGIIHHG